MSMFWNWKKNNKNDKIEYKGNKNKTNYPEFVDMCKLTQKQLKAELLNVLCRNGYSDVVLENGYIYAKGTIPVLLTAHMDTVHKEQIKEFYEYIDGKTGHHLLSSPQGIGGDDRCGTYIIKKIVETTNLRPSILFCEDEEIGGIGSNKFCRTEYVKELEQLNYFIEIDRANSKDAVFYDCDNKEFKNWIQANTGYIEAHGSFSDICHLSDESDIASVNLSCGYYNAHTLAEYVDVEEMLATMQTIIDLLGFESKQFKYEPKTYINYYNGYYGKGNYGGWYGYDDDYFYNKSTEKKVDKKKKEEDTLIYCIEAMTESGEILFAYGESEYEVWANLFMENGDVCFNDLIDFDIYTQ